MVPEKISLAEANMRRLEVSIDDIMPEDRKKIHEASMSQIDSLPPEIRQAIKNETWGLGLVGEAFRRWRSGTPVPAIVSWINKANADFTQIQRQKGLLP